MAHEHPELSAYLDGELPEAGRRAVAARLARDPEYAREYARLERTRTMLSLCMNEPVGVLDQLRPVLETEPARDAGPRVWRFAAAAGIAVAAAALAWTQWNRGPDDGQTPAVAPMLETRTDMDAARTDALRVAQADLEAEAQPTLDAVDPAQLPLAVTGTVTGTHASATLINTTTGESGTYAVGDEVLPGVTVARVESGAVVLNHGDAAVTLSVDGPTPHIETISVAGLWEGQFHEMYPDGSVSPSSQVIEVAIEQDGAVVSLAPKLARQRQPLTFSGVLRGTRLDGPAPGQEGEVGIRGEFDAEFQTFTGTLVALAENRDAAQIKLARLSEEESEARLAEEALRAEREAELERLNSRFRDYAHQHDGQFPPALADLEPFLEPGESHLIESTRERRVTYHAGLQTWGTPRGDVPRFETFRTELPMPDRLAAYEQERRQVYGTSAPLPPILLEVAHSEPSQTLVLNTAGAVMEDVSNQLDRIVDAELAALRGSSQNNLKQLGLVIKMFEQEHEMYGPGGWWSVYPEYLTDTEVLRSPIDKPGRVSYELLYPATNLYAYMTPELLDSVGVDVPNERAIQSQVPMVIETVEWPNPPGRNVLFADGHVEFLRADVYEARIAPFLRLR